MLSMSDLKPLFWAIQMTVLVILAATGIMVSLWYALKLVFWLLG